MNDIDERKIVNLVMELGPEAIQQWLNDNASKMQVEPFGEVTVIKNRFLPPYTGFFYAPKS